MNYNHRADRKKHNAFLLLFIVSVFFAFAGNVAAECIADGDCGEGYFCFKDACHAYECNDDAECGPYEGCWKHRCIKWFDIKILRIDSPIKTEEFLDFTYVMKGVADIKGDVVVDFWLEKDGKIAASGSDTIYLGSFEEKTETTSIFLPSTIESGAYEFYVQVNYGKYIAKAHRALQIGQGVPLVLDMQLSEIESLETKDSFRFATTYSFNKDAPAHLFVEEKISERGNVVWSKEADMIVEKSKEVSEEIGKLEPGNYNLEIIGNYGDGKTLRVTRAFSINLTARDVESYALPVLVFIITMLFASVLYWERRKIKTGLIKEERWFVRHKISLCIGAMILLASMILYYLTNIGIIKSPVSQKDLALSLSWMWGLILAYPFELIMIIVALSVAIVSILAFKRLHVAARVHGWIARLKARMRERRARRREEKIRQRAIERRIVPVPKAIKKKRREIKLPEGAKRFLKIFSLVIIIAAIVCTAVYYLNHSGILTYGMLADAFANAIMFVKAYLYEIFIIGAAFALIVLIIVAFKRLRIALRAHRWIAGLKARMREHRARRMEEKRRKRELKRKAVPKVVETRFKMSEGAKRFFKIFSLIIIIAAVLCAAIYYLFYSGILTYGMLASAFATSIMFVTAYFYEILIACITLALAVLIIIAFKRLHIAVRIREWNARVRERRARRLEEKRRQRELKRNAVPKAVMKTRTETKAPKWPRILLKISLIIIIAAIVCFAVAYLFYNGILTYGIIVAALANAIMSASLHADKIFIICMALALVLLAIVIFKRRMRRK